MDPTDKWTRTLIDLSNAARRATKAVFLHTHINHSREITWVTAAAADLLYREGVTVRNQAVLLRGINDTTEAQANLMHDLVQLNIQPVSRDMSWTTGCDSPAINADIAGSITSIKVI